MPTTFIKRTSPSTSLTNRTPITTTWDQRVDFLLLEDGFCLLLEDGFKIVLSGVSDGSTEWTNRSVI